MSVLVALLIDFAVGFLIRVCSRRAFWSILACVVIPTTVAVMAFGPQTLLAEASESQGLAIMGFVFLALFGFTACATGVLVGYLLRQRKRWPGNAV